MIKYSILISQYWRLRVHYSSLHPLFSEHQSEARGRLRNVIPFVRCERAGLGYVLVLCVVICVYNKDKNILYGCYIYEIR